VSLAPAELSSRRRGRSRGRSWRSSRWGSGPHSADVRADGAGSRHTAAPVSSWDAWSRARSGYQKPLKRPPKQSFTQPRRCPLTCTAV
jgi:hypothetical protein